MGEPFPVLDSDADYSTALKLFAERHMAILVKDNTGIWGIITKSDVVDYVLASID